MGWTKWAKFVITGGGNMPLPSIGTGTGKGEDYYVLPDGAYYGEEGATPYEKAAQKFVVQANPSYSLLSNDAKGNIKVVAAVEGWDDLPDDAVEQEKKSTITKAAVQSVITSWWCPLFANIRLYVDARPNLAPIIAQRGLAHSMQLFCNHVQTLRVQKMELRP